MFLSCHETLLLLVLQTETSVKEDDINEYEHDHPYITCIKNLGYSSAPCL